MIPHLIESIKQDINIINLDGKITCYFDRCEYFAKIEKIEAKKWFYDFKKPGVRYYIKKKNSIWLLWAIRNDTIFNYY